MTSVLPITQITSPQVTSSVSKTVADLGGAQPVSHPVNTQPENVYRLPMESAALEADESKSTVTVFYDETLGRYISAEKGPYGETKLHVPPQAAANYYAQTRTTAEDVPSSVVVPLTLVETI